MPEEKTNQDLYDKMIEGFNIILGETDKIKSDTLNIKEKTEPTNHNVRNIFASVNSMLEKLDSLIRRVRDLEEEVKKIQR